MGVSGDARVYGGMCRNEAGPGMPGRVRLILGSRGRDRLCSLQAVISRHYSWSRIVRIRPRGRTTRHPPPRIDLGNSRRAMGVRSAGAGSARLCCMQRTTPPRCSPSRRGTPLPGNISRS